MNFDLNEYLEYHRYSDAFGRPQVPWIICADGFTISVQANVGAYCLPRYNNTYWTHVECGFPSAVPEFIMEYCEDTERPTDTIYPYVPVELVEKLIEHHGGLIC